MSDLQIELEHIFIFIIIAFLLYHVMNRCNCNNGFRVGAAEINLNPNCEIDCTRCKTKTGCINNNTVGEGGGGYYGGCKWIPRSERRAGAVYGKCQGVGDRTGGAG